MATVVETRLDGEIIQCIDKALYKYGNTVSNAVFWHLKFKAKLDKKDIPSKPELFEADLHDIFGHTSGSIVSEIIREIRKSFRISPEDCVDLKTTICAVRSRSR